MRKLAVVFLVGVVALSAAVGVQAVVTKGKHEVKTVHLSGYNETPSALNTPATGTFSATIDDKAQTITYTLTYSGIPTSVTQAHIHFGHRFASQGIAVFLCSNLGNGPAGTPACPAQAGTVTRTVHASDVVGPAAQGIQPGDFASVVKAIRAGVAYANVHTTQFPGGEIRAQLQGHGHDRH